MCLAEVTVKFQYTRSNQAVLCLSEFWLRQIDPRWFFENFIVGLFNFCRWFLLFLLTVSYSRRQFLIFVGFLVPGRKKIGVEGRGKDIQER